MSNLSNFGNKINTNGFDKRPEDTKLGGRPISIKKEIKNLLEQDGKVTIPKEEVISINANGSVTIKLPTKKYLAQKLLSLATGGKNATTLRALITLLETFDGKPTQNIEIEKNPPPIQSIIIKEE